MEFSMFPIDHGESLSAEISEIIDMIGKSGYDYKLTAMGTIIETIDIKEALELVEKSYRILEKYDCQRIFASIKMDIRKSQSNRMTQKIQSVESRIGEVNK
ncbi:MAG: MTH1187 family thiamine-binding protein [Pseudomonadota bacterium]